MALIGVHLADHIIVGANAVVTHDFTEKNIVLAGVPAKKISNRGNDGRGAISVAFVRKSDMGKMKFQETALPGVYVIEPTVFGDTRGYFMESYNEADFREAGFDLRFVQDNQSGSVKGVLRGLHFQRTHPQTKLVRVLHGEVFDVAVDLRRSSPTYGKWIGVLLSAENKKQLLIPKGFAHGFLVVSDTAEFAYKCDDFYHPEDEGGILYNDPDIGITWPEVGALRLSEKDKNNPRLSECRIEF